MKRLRWIAAAIVALLALPLFALAGCQRSLLYFPHAEIVTPEVEGVEVVRIATPDGENLVAWWLAPTDPAQPVFIYFDGNAGAPEFWNGRWREIKDHGAGFLAVYYRGYSGSTGRPTEQGLHEDARAGYDWLAARGYQPKDIVIHGLSLGTSVATKLATERRARALILEAPFTAAVDVAKERYPVPLIGMFMMDQFRTRDWIGDINMPLLLAHGDADEVIAFEHGERLFALAKEPKTFVRMPGSEHTSMTRDGLYAHIWRFLDEHPPE